MDQTTKTILIIVGIIAGAVLLGFVLTQTPVAEIVPTPGPTLPPVSTITPIPTATLRSTFTPPPTFTAVPPFTPIPSNTPLPSPTTPPQPTAVPPTATINAQPTPNPILNINWQWVSLTDQGQTVLIPNPLMYTIAFKPDGTLSGKADCNQFSGVYSQQGGFSIQITTTTSAICGEGSMDQQYLQLLNSVAAGGPDGTGKLILQTAGGAQSLTFQNGGPAQ